MATGEELSVFTWHTGPVYSVSFSPDGKTLASGSKDRTVRMMELELMFEYVSESNKSENFKKVLKLSETLFPCRIEGIALVKYAHHWLPLRDKNQTWEYLIQLRHGNQDIVK